jgi:hypothetical protein
LERLAMAIHQGKDFSLEGTIERSQCVMSPQSDSYSLVTLSDRVVPGFAGIMRASMLASQSNFPREIKVIVGSPSHIGEGKAINFAKKVTKHLRVSRGWSFVNASVECEDAP